MVHSFAEFVRWFIHVKNLSDGSCICRVCQMVHSCAEPVRWFMHLHMHVTLLFSDSSSKVSLNVMQSVTVTSCVLQQSLKG